MNANDTHPFEANLDRQPSNYVPLSPVSFLTRAASAFAGKLAVIDGERRYTYAQLLDRCTRQGVRPQDRRGTLALLGPGH